MPRRDPFALQRPSQRAAEESLAHEEAFQLAILAIPIGKVSTYGQVAAAAGYPRYHRAVARLLKDEHAHMLPWHRVLGADGRIKTSGSSAAEQRRRLEEEGVVFIGERVDLLRYAVAHS